VLPASDLGTAVCPKPQRMNVARRLA